jgi:predicted RND superfamily exporter protein
MIERRWGHDEPPRGSCCRDFHATVEFSIAHPRIVLVSALALVLAGLTGLPKYRLESDLKHIMSRDVPALEVDERIQEIFGIAPVSYLIPVESLQEARVLTAQMLREPDVVAVQSPADLIREDADQRAARMREALAASTGTPNRLAERLARALELGPPSLEALPWALRAGIVGEGGALALQVIPESALLDADAIEDQVARLRSIAPATTGTPAVALLLMRGTRDWIPIVLAAIAFVVLAVLILSFRRTEDVVLSLIPVGVGAVASLGIFFWLGLNFSILTGIVVPVILGLGVDDGIHIVERLRRLGRRDDAALLEAVEGVGRAIFLTSATTTLSFVGLFYCRHYGLESMAQFMSMGVPLCFVASITVLPAVVKLFPPR